MSRAAATPDRNILLGFIALQMDFVSREALIAAMHAWVLNKATPLGQILQDHGALIAARRALLDALVDEHIHIHDGDVQRSLAALNSIGSVREELSRIADPELQANLPTVSAPCQEHDDEFDRASTARSMGDSTSAGTRFRILSRHAKGGLGEVFVARDTELNREVALKEIQDQFADDSVYRARFEFEAEVTGGLEHPGIVPVYGLGHTVDGRPFYAMQFIKGESLKVAIHRFHEADQQPGRDPGERMMALRGLLGRFLDVCDAVAYAHGRGVLHRDLKPGNIMLGRYGQTLVLDWGLAKALDHPQVQANEPVPELPLKPASESELELTQAGMIIGTPAYMSPEQASGRRELGPRSDVYCLGATLYQLLTSHAPFEDQDLGEVCKKVISGDFPRPKVLSPRISPALEAVCLKAMALDPEDRYASAEALRADLERWLADEPVSAWREPLSIRARRWVHRRRTAVTAAASILIVTAAGLAVVTERERMNAEQLAHATAESSRRRDQTLKAVDALAIGVKMVVAQSRLPQYHGDPLNSYGSLGSLPSEAADSKGAAEFLRMAIELSDRLAAEQPSNPDYQEILGTCYFTLGAVQSNTGDSKGAADLFLQAIAIFTKLVTAQPTVQDYYLGLAKSHDNLGMVRHDAGDRLAAVESYLQSIEVGSRLAAAQPDDPDCLDYLAGNYTNLGIAQSEMGDKTGAAASFRRALSISTRVKSPTSVAAHQDNLARTYTSLGALQHEAADLRGAAESYLRATTILARLSASRPGSAEYRTKLAMGYSNLASVQHEMGEPTKAEESCRRAIELQTTLVDSHPDVAGYLSVLGGSLHSLGLALEAQQRHAEAEQAYRSATERQRMATQREPRATWFGIFLRKHLSALARSLHMQGRADLAAKVFDQVFPLDAFAR
jgi:serine/threonine-protein kinase